MISESVERTRLAFRDGQTIQQGDNWRVVSSSKGAYLCLPWSGAEVAIRVAPALATELQFDGESKGTLRFTTPLGRLESQVETFGPDLARIRLSFIADENCKFPDIGRDLQVIRSDIPLKIEAYATQRGLNGGLAYAGTPELGTLLYFQDFSESQEYFQLTETTPDDSVDLSGPDIGYRIPTNEDKPLPAGKKVILSAAYVCLSDTRVQTGREICTQFLRSFAKIYRLIHRPEQAYKPWPTRAHKTLQNLSRNRLIQRHDFGQLYMTPYVGAEIPDSMTQMSLINSLDEYAKWRGRKVALVDRLRRGMGRFYDPDLRSVKRYLPNAVQSKDQNEVDSWYLYHPLMNLARCALRGHNWARELLKNGIGYGIAAAHHFDYQWPIQYDARDFSIIEKYRGDSELGQTDVGGIYAYLMLLCSELFEDDKYIDEATRAIEALKDHGFDLLYQSNLSAYGALACTRLARKTGDSAYVDQAGTFIATLLHNSVIWNSELNLARHYPTFLGLSALHDSPYMAAYECFESFVALRDTIAEGAAILPDEAMLFACESSRYAIERSWSFFPDALPEDGLATELRNGHIDRSLSFPVEDLYADGRAAGEVGQEVYGGGAPFMFTTRAFTPLQDGNLLFCDLPFQISESRPEVRIYGPPELAANVMIVDRIGEPKDKRGFKKLSAGKIHGLEELKK